MWILDGEQVSDDHDGHDDQSDDGHDPLSAWIVHKGILTCTKIGAGSLTAYNESNQIAPSGGKGKLMPGLKSPNSILAIIMVVLLAAAALAGVIAGIKEETSEL